MTTVTLPDGTRVPSLGIGTWRMGERSSHRQREIAAIRLALELGTRLIDTAEMYGEGGAEEVVGEALAQAFRAGGVKREEVFVVSKVYPHNASRKGAVAACERSLARLGLESIDLYLLHWKGSHPLAQTIEAFEALRGAGKVRHWGVSNFDQKDMQRLVTTAGGSACATNQVYYSASERGVEFDLLPWMRSHAMPLMAYCPIDQGTLAGDAVFARVGKRHGITATQAALAWVMRGGDVIAIPKAVDPAHVRENCATREVAFSPQDLSEIDAAFPPPEGPTALTMV